MDRLVVLVLLSIGLAVNASPVAKLFTKSGGERIPGQYIVVLKPQDNVDTFLRQLEVSKSSIFTNSSVLNVFRHSINGFFAKLTPGAVQQFLNMEQVMYIEENGLVQAQQVASWGLDRVDQRYLPLDGEAKFTGDGKGVNAYILDTGIFPGNVYFGGRGEVAYDAVGGEQEYGLDCHGHGTHCAGTIGANTYGIATGATLYGVRVLNCFGSGTTAQVIAGLDWVRDNGKRPAVASMSLGGGASPTMDLAVEDLTAAGVLVSVAAGNNNGDACDISPARVENAVTAGATDITDARAVFSNYGSCVDIFAPGVDIPSTWIGSDDATNTISGTSMACPHVTGGAVIALGNDNSLSPSELKAKLTGDGTPDVVSDPGPDSPNLMLYIPRGNQTNAL